MTEPVRIAVVGLGKIARDQHLPAIRNSPDFILAATIDPAGSGVEAIPHFGDLGALLASDCQVDAVALCTPPVLRAQLAIRALSAGKHVLLEKPPATTVAEAEALADRARHAGRTIFTAWHSRYAGQVPAAQSWLEGKSIDSVSIEWKEDVRHWHPGQAWIFEEGGFGVFDPAINALSIVTSILPGKLALRSSVLEVPENCAAPIAGSLEMETESGVPVGLEMDFLQTGQQTWDIRIDTDAGRMTLKNGGSELHLPGEISRGEDREYPLLYAHFADLIARRESAIDLAPLRLVEAALASGEKRSAPPFHE